MTWESEHNYVQFPSVNFENVIKPLIDLDGDIHTQIRALTVSQLESIPASDIQP